MRLRNARVRCDMKSPELIFSEMDLATPPQTKDKGKERASVQLFCSLYISNNISIRMKGVCKTMCAFCQSEERIVKEPELFKNTHTGLSLVMDEESNFLFVRMEVGAIGYTLPIKVNYCMFCGEKIGS